MLGLCTYHGFTFIIQNIIYCIHTALNNIVFLCIFWMNLEHVFEQNCCAFHTLSMPLLLPNSGAIYVTLLLCVLQCAFCLPIKTFEWHDTPFFPVYRYLCYLYHIYFFLSVRHINIYKHLYRMIIYKLHLMIFFEKIN